MCVTCLFGVQTLSLLSTRHVLSFQSIAIGVTQYKHTVPRQQDQAMQTIEMGWFNILKFLWFFDDERDISWILVLQGMDWEFGWQGLMIGKKCSSKITMKWCLAQARIEFRDDSCG
jgi:hypothetical protein